MFKKTNAPPNTKDFMALRRSVGWENCSEEVTASSISNSLFWVSFYDENQLVATGRVIGDGALYFYIQDVIVASQYQGNGLGLRIMECIENYLYKHTTKHATIGLLSALGKERFYQRFGYLLRDGQKLGQALCKYV